MKRGLTMVMLVFGLVAMRSAGEECTHRQAALELLEVSNARAMLDQMLDMQKGMMQQQFGTMDLPPEKRVSMQRVQTEVMTWLSDLLDWEKFRQMYVDAYIDVFSEEEIKGITAFYRTPEGQKMIEKMPELMQKIMVRTQAMVQQTMPEFRRRVEQAMAELMEE